MTPNRRWRLWLGLLAVAAALVAFDRRDSANVEVVEASARPPQRKAGETSPARMEAQTVPDGSMILAIRPRTGSAHVENTFAPHDWTPPPAPKREPPPPPPPPPTAPPLPFTVLGKKLEDGAWQVFLARQDQIFSVKQQDIIENTYRIEEIRPPIMTLTYLPLNQRQTLPIGGTE